MPRASWQRARARRHDCAALGNNVGIHPSCESVSRPGLAKQRDRLALSHLQLRSRTIAQNAITITRTQSKLYAIRSERFNFRFGRIEIFSEIVAASRLQSPRRGNLLSRSLPFSPPQKGIASVSHCARFSSLTNPMRLRNALSLHYEHNSIDHSHSSVDWSVTYVAV